MLYSIGITAVNKREAIKSGLHKKMFHPLIGCTVARKAYKEVLSQETLFSDSSHVLYTNFLLFRHAVRIKFIAL